ncbi:carbon-nitrogen hydrolase family protein [Treponema pedis]|uniref:carbon-nitrogen hydrolase family protein n=1 Tax=Treponema pedis TaxID=409322 RepID=UPI00313416B7
MKICLCAAKNKSCDTEYNISQIKLFIEKTKDEKPDLLLFGEAFLQGFDSLCFEYKKDILTAISIHSSEISKIGNLAQKNKIAIGFGFIENNHGAIFSTYLIIGKTGKIIDKYQRVSQGWRIKNTCADYREGKDFHTFQLENKKFAVMICGDLWEDNLLSKIISMEAEIFLWPVFCAYTAEEWEASAKAEYSARTAILNQTVLFVDSIVKINDDKYSGSGAVIWRHGNILKELPAGQSGFLTYEI